jgi:hypothetical protein
MSCFHKSLRHWRAHIAKSNEPNFHFFLPIANSDQSLNNDILLLPLDYVRYGFVLK